MRKSLLISVLCWISVAIAGKLNQYGKENVPVVNKNGNKGIKQMGTPPDERLPLLPVLHSLKYKVPYTFTECVADLQLIFTALIDDISQNSGTGTNKNKNNDDVNQVIKNFSNAKNRNSKKDVIYDQKFLTYSVDAFSTQVLQICSPGDFDEILQKVLEEYKKSNYPETCTITLNNTENESSKYDDCFKLLLEVNKTITSRPKSDLDLPVKGTPSKSKKIPNNNSDTFLNDYRKQRSEKELYQDLTNFALQGYEESNIKPKKKNAVGKIITQEKISVLTKTVPKTLYKVTNRPTMVYEYLTTTETERAVETVTETEKSVNTLWKVNKNAATLTVTDLILDVTTSTFTIAKKTIVSNNFVTEYVTTSVFNTSVVNVMNNDNQQGEIDVSASASANNFQVFSPVQTTTVTAMVLPSEGFLRPFGSRMCDAITRVGLQCPFRTPTTTQQPNTDNVNININVNENRGNIKVLRRTDTTNLVETTTTTTTTEVTKTREITQITKTTKTYKTTETKFKTKIKTKTKNIHDCDDETHDPLPENNIIEDEDYETDILNANNLISVDVDDVDLIVQQLSKDINRSTGKSNDTLNDPNYNTSITTEKVYYNTTETFLQYMNTSVYNSAGKIAIHATSITPLVGIFLISIIFVLLT